MRELLITCGVFLVFSLIHPKDYGVWLFEITAGLIGVAILAATYRTRNGTCSWHCSALRLQRCCYRASTIAR